MSLISSTKPFSVMQQQHNVIITDDADKVHYQVADGFEFNKNLRAFQVIFLFLFSSVFTLCFQLIPCSFS